jgi:hypothetical protein
MVQTIHPQVFTFAVEEVYEEELGLEPIWCYSLPSLKAEIGSKTPGSKRWSRSRITLWKGGHVDCLNAKPYPQRNNVRPFFSSLVEDGRTDFFRRERGMTATPVLPLYTSRQVAEMRARYLSSFSKGIFPPVVVQASVPKAFLRSSLLTLGYKYKDCKLHGALWKKTVYNLMLNPFGRLMGMKGGLAIGAISSNGTRAVRKVSRWTDLDGRNFLWEDGEKGKRPAMQYILRGDWLLEDRLLQMNGWNIETFWLD